MLLPVLGHTYRNFFKVTGGGKVKYAGTASNQTADGKREDLEPRTRVDQDHYRYADEIPGRGGHRYHYLRGRCEDSSGA